MSAPADRVPSAFEMVLAEMRDWHRAYSACRIAFHELAREMIRHPVSLTHLPPDAAQMLCLIAVDEHHIAAFIAPHIDPDCRDSVLTRLDGEARILCHQQGDGGGDAEA
ncbi:MAG: hypothetical protein ABF479_11185 [Gluconacetobacter sp.]